MRLAKQHENVTFRIDAGVVLWARTRALHERRSLNHVVASFLADYARIPQWWLDGDPPPPWPPPISRGTGGG